MNSCLYTTNIYHERITPKNHRFSYNQFMFYIDLSEIEKLHKKFSFFSYEYANLYSLKTNDHLSMGRRSIFENIKTFISSQFSVNEVENIFLLTQLRSLGFLFNPVSFYFLKGKKNEDLGILAEVMNTFREFKMYYLPPERKCGSRYQDVQDKYFYISPFSELKTKLVFNLQEPGENLNLHVNEKKDDYSDTFFISQLRGKKMNWTDGNLLKMSIRYPLNTFLSFMQIHLQAYNLYKKKIHYYKKQSDFHLQKNVHIPNKFDKAPVL